jgi:hypothetical protein
LASSRSIDGPVHTSSSSSGTLDNSSRSGQVLSTSRSSSTSSSRGGSSSSDSSIGRSRLASLRSKKRHSWSQLPTQRQLLAAGRADLVAGLQKHGHERVRLLLGLPPPKRKQLRKVGGCGCVCYY